VPGCDASTRSRTWSIGTSPPSRATGCAATCREGAVAAGARRALLLDRGRGHQVVRVRRLADRRVPRPGGDARDPRDDPRVSPAVELARRARRRRLRGRGSAVRVREQADDRRRYGIRPGDEPAVRGRAGAVAPERARASRGPGVHGSARAGPGAAVRGRTPTLRYGA